MTIAKKLLLAVLLVGTTLTAACGDDGAKKVAEGGECDAKKECDAKLVCVGAAANATTGKCQKTCTGAADTSCGEGKECKEDGHKVGSGTAKYCAVKAAA